MSPSVSTHVKADASDSVILGAGGRVKPDWIMVDDRQGKHPEGAYYLVWTEGGKRRRMAVGTDATAACNSRNRKQSKLEAMAQRLVVTNPIADDSSLRLRNAKEDFLEVIQLSRQRKPGWDTGSPCATSWSTA